MEAVGVDFSPLALLGARDSRERAGIDPESGWFVEADVYDAGAVEAPLESGGEAPFVDDHPVEQAFDGHPPEWSCPYHGSVKTRTEAGETYAGDDDPEENVTDRYSRPLSTVVTAAAEAGPLSCAARRSSPSRSGRRSSGPGGTASGTPSPRSRSRWRSRRRSRNPPERGGEYQIE